MLTINESYHDLLLMSKCVTHIASKEIREPSSDRKECKIVNNTLPLRFHKNSLFLIKTQQVQTAILVS